MSDLNKPSTAQRSSLIRGLRWVGSGPGLRRLLLMFLWLATAVALFYGFENWRGRRAWDKYRQTLLARGEQLDLPSIIPPSVPAEQNFAETPFIKSWFVRGGGINNHWGDNFTALSGKIPNPSKERGSRHFLDLGAWQRAFAGDSDQKGKIASVNVAGEARAKAAREILEELKEIEPIINELREASRRPFSRYPVHYDLENPWGILLPHLSSIRSTCHRIQLKACAELAAGHPDQAMEDVNLMFRLVDSLRGEPFLIAFLVRVSDLQTTIQPVWEGLVEHRWTPSQLEQMQKWFETWDLKTDVKKPLDCERAAALWTVDILRKKGNFAELLSIEPDTGTFEVATRGLMGKLLTLMPRGWSYQEQLTYCRFFDQQFQKTVLASGRRLVPSVLDSTTSQTEEMLKQGSIVTKLLNHKLTASLLLPGLGNMGYRAASGQVAADQAAIACALERYRLTHKRFPAKLEELAPRFLRQVPHDILSGRPYFYRPEGESGYILYSVGWNEQDDNGVPGQTMFDKKAGDWTWQIP